MIHSTFFDQEATNRRESVVLVVIVLAILAAIGLIGGFSLQFLAGRRH